MKSIEHDKLLAEKILTALYPKLCEKCKAIIREIIIELGKDSAEKITSDLGIIF